MHINKMMIIKVAIDATVAIIITTFLSSSGGFRLNGLSEPLLVAIFENREPLFVTIVIVTAAVVVLVVVLGEVQTDVLGVCVVDTNRVIGS